MSDMQQSRATLLNKVACLTSLVAQLLTSRATKLLDRNHQLSPFFGTVSLRCCAVIGQLFVYMPTNS